MKTAFYNNQTEKLQKALNKYLKKLRKPLIQKFGEIKTNKIIESAKEYYPEIITKIPFVDTRMYDGLLLLNSRMMAVKKGMKKEGIGVEEFVKFQIENLRKQTSNIPMPIKKLMGKLYISKLVRPLIKNVGKSASKNGWTTQVIDGAKNDDYNMKIITSDCQMLNFMHSVGEGDIQPYCTFADFTSAEALGLGFKQISTIESGKCAYCFSAKGKVHWPDTLERILNN